MNDPKPPLSWTSVALVAVVLVIGAVLILGCGWEVIQWGTHPNAGR